MTPAHAEAVKSIKSVMDHRDRSIMRYKRLNIILIVDAEFRKKALELARNMVIREEEVFHIDDKNYFAHVTAYSPEFPENSIAEVIDRIGKLAKDTKKFDLLATGVSVEDRFVIIDFKSNDRIKELHETIVMMLNRLREGWIRKKFLPKD